MTTKQVISLRNKIYATLVEECKCWEDIKVEKNNHLCIQVTHEFNDFHGCQLMAINKVVESYNMVTNRTICLCTAIENNKIVLNIYC